MPAAPHDTLPDGADHSADHVPHSADSDTAGEPVYHDDEPPYHGEPGDAAPTPRAPARPVRVAPVTIRTPDESLFAHADAYERDVVAALCRTRDGYDIAVEAALSDVDFEDDALGALTRAAYRIGKTGSDPTVPALIDEMQRHERATLADRAARVLTVGEHGQAPLTALRPRLSALPHACERIADAAARRRAVAAAERLWDAAESKPDLTEHVTEHLRSIALIGGAGASRTVDMAEAAAATLREIDEAPSTNGITGVPSGLHALDEMTSGWQKTNLIIIAARPSMGKSALAQTLLRHAAEAGVPPYVVTLEMSAQQLASRALASEASVDLQAITRRRVTPEERAALAEAEARMRQYRIAIDDTVGLDVPTLTRSVRRFIATHGADASAPAPALVIVDYLQLMRGTAGRGASREQEVSTISRGLKEMAMSLGVPVIALAQLSRAVETRGGEKRPQLSDLRESGSIEQDANDVIFLYRAEKYNITEDDRGNPTKGVAELIIGKQRNGPTGTVEVSYQDKFARFGNLERRYEDGGYGYGAGSPYGQAYDDRLTRAGHHGGGTAGPQRPSAGGFPGYEATGFPGYDDEDTGSRWPAGITSSEASTRRPSTDDF